MDNNMNELIDNMKYLSEYDKEVIGGIFDNLIRHQNSMFEKIIAKTELQQRERELALKWNIITAAISKDEVEQSKKNGLYEILDTVCFAEKLHYEDLNLVTDNKKNGLCSAGVSFLFCKYQDVFKYLNRKYKACVTTNNDSFEVEYYFEKYGGYYDIERIIERTAMQYEVDVPILLEPISRRAINVIVDLSKYGFSKSDNMIIDFQFAKNGLTEIIKEKTTLVWNVEIVEKNEIPRPRENTDKKLLAKIVPFFEEVYQLYQFPSNENEFYYVESKIQDIKRYGSSVYLNLHEKEKIEDVRYSKLIVHDIPQKYIDKIDCSFRTFFDDRCINKVRIRTEADIDYVMNSMKNDIALYQGLCRKRDNEDSIYIYNSYDAYYYPKNKILRSASICNVQFRSSENIYFEDYVSYILSYLNYYYPEFYWVGVV